MSLPDGAPLAAQYLAHARSVLPADVATLPHNSRRFRAALRDLAATSPGHLMPTRRELALAADYLDRLAARRKVNHYA